MPGEGEPLLWRVGDPGVAGTLVGEPGEAKGARVVIFLDGNGGGMSPTPCIHKNIDTSGISETKHKQYMMQRQVKY